MDCNRIKAIAEKIEKLFYKDGACHVQTHYEIGKTLHIDTYYYAKEYFKDSKNCEEIASFLEQKIRILFPDFSNTTFVGCGEYSGLYLNEAIERLKKGVQFGEGQEPNYAIIDNTYNQLSVFFRPEVVRSRIVIILPITCTFTTAFFMKEFIEKQLLYSDAPTQRAVDDKFISLFLVCDEMIYQQIHVAGDNNSMGWDIPEKKRKLYKSFQWKRIYNNKIELFSENGKRLEGHFLIPLSSLFYLPEECPHCFPDLAEKENAEEYSLFPTRVNHDTPDLIFGLPHFANKKGTLLVDDFSELNLSEGTHLYGHLKFDKNSYLHFLKRDSFYENNKVKILDFFKEELNKQMIGWDENKDRLLVITPKHSHSSRLWQDLLQEKPLLDRNVTILMIDIINEFLENFKIEFERHKPYKKIVFFDYLISAGKKYKIVHDYLIDVNESKGFDHLLFVIDRTTEFSKSEILLTVTGDETRFASFFKLNLPLMSATKSGNPIQERVAFLTELIPECHLDALKLLMGEEIVRGMPLSLDRLDLEYKKIKLEEKERHFRKLHISHNLSNWFFKNSSYTEFDNNSRLCSFDLTVLDEKLIPDFLEDRSFFKNSKASLPTEKERDQITDLLIKTLSRPPFRFYHGIYQTVFEYTRRELRNIVKGLSRDLDAYQADRFKFYIRRSIELNSPAIISFFFIEKVRELFNNNPCLQLLSLKYFLLGCFKELIYKNPARSIQLERIINNDELLPLPLKTPSMELSQAIRNEFYQLGRIIKTENIYLLNELKKLFISHIRQEEDIAADIKLLLAEKQNTVKNPGDMRDMIKQISGRIFRNLQRQAHFYREDLNIMRTSVYNLQDVEYYNDLEGINNNTKKFLETPVSIPEIKKFIKSFYLSNDSNHNIIRLANEFLEASRLKEDRRADILCSTFATVYLLESRKRQRADFIGEIKSILKEACSIMDTGLEYAFFIEYKKRDKESEINTNNIFTISSEHEEDYVEPKLSPEGFVYRMFYGLTDDKENKSNIQTFIVLVKGKDGQIHSFRDSYYSAELAALGGEPIEVAPQCINYDYQNGEIGLSSFSDAKMILLFRLSEIGLGNNGNFSKKYSHTGQAVFAICYPQRKFDEQQKSETEALTDFINVEKVRMLLLCKNQLLDYLHKQFENDAFINLRETLLERRFKKSMEHGLQRYFNGMQQILSKSTLDERDIEILQFLKQTINAHLYTISGNSLTLNRKDSIEVDDGDIKRIFENIMNAPQLASGYLHENERNVIIETGIIICHPVLFLQVIPELILNMRRNALYYFEGTPLFKIVCEKDTLLFQNSCNLLYLTKRELIGKSGGIRMCNDILNILNLGSVNISIDENENLFTASINLKPV